VSSITEINKAQQVILNQTATSFLTANALHSLVAEHLLEHLECIQLTPDCILDLGCGTGALLSSLKQRFKKTKILGVDVAYERLAKHTQPSFFGDKRLLCCANATALPLADASVDMVISNLMSHWCGEPELWLKEAKRVLKTDGLLIFSYFATDTFKEIGPAKTPFLDMHDMGDLLVKIGFTQPVLDMENITVDYDNHADMVADLEATGEIALIELQPQPMVTPTLTYEIVYAHAWKSATPMTSKIDQDGMVRIPLDKITRPSKSVVE
jgi:malonyl-CoA O-methyltransferase